MILQIQYDTAPAVFAYQAQQLANTWRKSNGHVNDQGFVFLLNGEVQGWNVCLDDPDGSQPGYIAINQLGDLWLCDELEWIPLPKSFGNSSQRVHNKLELLLGVSLRYVVTVVVHDRLEFYVAFDKTGSYYLAWLSSSNGVYTIEVVEPADYGSFEYCHGFSWRAIDKFVVGAAFKHYSKVG